MPRETPGSHSRHPTLVVDIAEPQPMCRAALAAAVADDAALILGRVGARPQDLAGSPGLVVAGLRAVDPHDLATLRELCTVADGVLLLLPDLAELDWAVLRSLRAHADGGVSRYAELPTVMEALRAVAVGRSYWHLGSMLDADSLPHPSVKLTDRELEVLDLLSTGCTDREIARQLSISVRTVWSHLERVRAKSGLHNRVELTLLALASSRGPTGYSPAGNPRGGAGAGPASSVAGRQLRTPLRRGTGPTVLRSVQETTA